MLSLLPSQRLANESKENAKMVSGKQITVKLEKNYRKKSTHKKSFAGGATAGFDERERPAERSGIDLILIFMASI
jgi:hypothetical protein